jgi:hypothetical protein
MSIDWKAEYLKSVESGCITLDELREARAELDATNRQVEILSDALAESRREVAALKINAALDKKAENARELGLDYEPVGLIDRLKNPEQHYEFTDPKKANAVLMSLCQEAADALAAQQEHEPENEPHVSLASVQEPVGWFKYDKVSGCWHPQYDEFAPTHAVREGWKQLYTTPPAQPAVPDALNPKDENPAYAAGWNDCRAEMLKGMKP